MKVKSKILWSFLSAVFFSLFCFGSFAQNNAPIILEVNNNTKQYHVYLTGIEFSPGSYLVYNFVKKEKSGLSPGNSGSVVIQPDNEGELEGEIMLFIGTINSTQAPYMQLGFNFTNQQFTSQIINGSPGLEDKVTIEIQDATSKWIPGQKIKVNISNLLP